ncbi:MAG TPA: ABC transporter permease [Caulobacteraceae bacterium]|jgi:capsular polysaccharide transport system permease protein
MSVTERLRATAGLADRQRRIIWALALREVATRYGRENLGFLWVIGEPLLFCGSVSVMWSIIKPSYEHGVRIVPFVVTGYMPILLVRHILAHGMYAVRVNAPLLYHRQISVLHLFFARSMVEFIGVTFAFFVIFAVLAPFGLMEPPSDLALVYVGWFLLGWISFALAMIFGAVFEMFEPIERIVQVITYILVPLSGTFYMAAWIPEAFRGYVLLLPFLNTVEMVRGGFFGEFVQTYYNIPYTLAWAAGLTVLGLLLTAFVRNRVLVE